MRTIRWRQQVKTRGGFSAGMAAAVREAGGDEAAALAAEALGATCLVAHGKRLLRRQWILFELARLSAEVETAAALAIKAAGAPDDGLLGLCARLHGGGAARGVTTTGARLLRACGELDRKEVEAWKAETRPGDLLATAEGESQALDEAACRIAER